MTKITYLILLAWIVVAPTRLESVDAPVQSTALTLYNDGTGFVRQVLEGRLPVGDDVNWVLSDLAATLEAPTVRLVSLSHPGSFFIREQNFEYDLVNSQKILDRYLGQTVGFDIENRATGDLSRVEGTILSTAGAGVYEIDGEIHIGAPGRLILPSLPGGLALRPQLRWRLANEERSVQDLLLSYLMSGTSWWADYTLHLGKEGIAELDGWVTLQNDSGTSYPDAEIKLVAGSIHRAPKAPQEHMRRGMVADSMMMEVIEESFFEYHLYRLPSPTNLPDRSLKQVRFLTGDSVPYQTVYTLSNPWGYGGPSTEAGDPARVPIAVSIAFRNDEESSLGLPLPAGTLRMFMEDSRGEAQLVGEDNLGHTPKNEEISLQAGEAFDLVGEIRTLDFTKLYANRTKTDVEVRVRNHKEEGTAVVRYRARLWGDVTLSSTSSIQLEPLGNGWYEALIPIDAGQESILTYSILTK
ncbi:hypothetical protein H8D30_01015 [bacterium]|nr:hypothetical protein [bacterium]